MLQSGERIRMILGQRASVAHVPFNPVVLIVGDGARAKFMCTKLRRLGGSVATAASIPLAGSLLKECSSFDAVVLSAEVPQDGWATAQALRKISRLDAPVWIVTEHGAGPLLRRQARANGVQFFPRREGLHRLFETLIRRSLDRLVGLVYLASELTEFATSASLLLGGA